MLYLKITKQFNFNFSTKFINKIAKTKEKMMREKTENEISEEKVKVKL